MKKTTVEIHQELSPPRKRAIVVKVILAMAILLLGIPFLMVMASTYFTHKGIMKDAYLMSHEYTQAVTDFYNNNHKCPTNKDIKVAITAEDTVAHIDFTSNPQTSSCYISSTLKQLGASTDGKLLVLTKAFSAQPANNDNWQCFSNANHWFLPKGCSDKLPNITTH